MVMVGGSNHMSEFDCQGKDCLRAWVTQHAPKLGAEGCLGKQSLEKPTSYGHVGV